MRSGRLVAAFLALAPTPSGAGAGPSWSMFSPAGVARAPAPSLSRLTAGDVALLMSPAPAARWRTPVAWTHTPLAPPPGKPIWDMRRVIAMLGNGR